MFDSTALVRIISEGGISYKENATSFIFTCPKCNKDKKLYIRKSDGRSQCMRCGNEFKGYAEKALHALYGTSLSVLKEQLYGDACYEPMADLELQFGDDDLIAMPDVFPTIDWPLTYSAPPEPDFIEGYKYLKSRGVGMDLIRKYDLRYCKEDSRVAIPIKIKGALIGWQARYIHKTEVVTKTGETYRIPKIITSESLVGRGGQCLMFQDNLDGAEEVLVCEGPFDALKGDLCGGNVATMGKNISTQQLMLIKKALTKAKAPKLYIGLDTDAGQNITQTLDYFGYDVDCYLVTPPKGKEDLGSCSLGEVLEQKRTAPLIKRGTVFFSYGSKITW